MVETNSTPVSATFVDRMLKKLLSFSFSWKSCKNICLTAFIQNHLKVRWKCRADVKLNEKLNEKFTKTWRGTSMHRVEAYLSCFCGTFTETPKWWKLPVRGSWVIAFMRSLGNSWNILLVLASQGEHKGHRVWAKCVPKMRLSLLPPSGKSQANTVFGLVSAGLSQKKSPVISVKQNQGFNLQTCGQVEWQRYVLRCGVC